MRVSAILALAGLASCAVSASVVINEIFYHAPGEATGLQWVEFHNPDASAADLSGWKLRKGANLEFHKGSSLAAGAFLVVALDAAEFRNAYRRAPDAVFTGPMKRKGDRLELVDASGKVVDAVKFGDDAPWPVIADGGSASLERICPTAPGDTPANWLASPPDPGMEQPLGSPGRPNSAYSKVPVPVIGTPTVSAEIAAPGQTLLVTARIVFPGGSGKAFLLRRLLLPGQESPVEKTQMQPDSDGVWAASLTAPEAGVLRLQIRAEGANGGVRVQPSDNDLRPAVSVAVEPKWPESKIDQFVVWQTRPSAGRPDHLTQEDHLRLGLLQRFRMETDLPGLWSSLVLDGTLPADRRGAIAGIFRKLVDERNVLVERTVYMENLNAAQAAAGQGIRSFTAAVRKALEPHLDPASLGRLGKWPAKRNPGDPEAYQAELILTSWLDIERDLLAWGTVDGLSEASFARLRDKLREIMARRDALAGSVKEVLSDGNRFEEFQRKLAALRGEEQAVLAEVLDDKQRAQGDAMHDESMAFRRPSRHDGPDTGGRARSAFLRRDAETGRTHLIDFVSVRPRTSGHKIHFPKDRHCDGMSAINVIFEPVDRFALAEPFAYEVYRRAGMKVPRTGFVRFTLDGDALGYQVMIEQPNRTMLRRFGLDAGGHLYKATWRGNTAEEMHEKKTRRRDGPDDLVEMLRALSGSKGDAQWREIRDRFDVGQVIDYFAVNMLLSHWDGYFNNYFAYHDTGGTGKWTLYPWDQDKTCGSYDGVPPGAVFAELPLDFGSSLSKAPGWRGARQPRTFVDYYRLPGASGWWRQPGWISGPFLANERARPLFVSRVKDLLEREFTEARLFPVLHGYAALLSEEVRFKAGLRGMRPDDASKLLRTDIAMLKTFVSRRRAFLLGQPELVAAAPFDPARLK